MPPPRPARVWPTACGGSAPPGAWRSSFYAMTSGQHAEQPPAKRRGPKPAISDQALRSRPGGIALGGRGLPQGLGSAGLSRHPGCPQAGAPPDAREQSASPHRCRRRGGNPHDGEIITHAPNLMWGTDGVRVFTVDDGWGWIFTAVEHWNAECRLACLQARRPLRRPAADLHGACRAVWLDRGRRGSGAGLADARLPVSVGPLHQPDQVLSSRPTPSSSPRPTASPSGSIAR